jgi:hypothetical protein
MKFDDVINSILKESQQRFAISYGEEMLHVGDILPKGLLFDMYNRTEKFYGSFIWEITNISKYKHQPVKMPVPPGQRDENIFVKSSNSPWTSVNFVIQNDEGSIDVENIISIECFNISLIGSSPEGGPRIPAFDSTPDKLVYQSNNKNGTKTCWINVVDYNRAYSVVQDIEIVSEREMTIATHKDHNELVDLIGL